MLRKRDTPLVSLTIVAPRAPPLATVDALFRKYQNINATQSRLVADALCAVARNRFKITLRAERCCRAGPLDAALAAKYRAFDQMLLRK